MWYLGMADLCSLSFSANYFGSQAKTRVWPAEWVGPDECRRKLNHPGHLGILLRF